MSVSDTNKLLKECDAGVKMAIASIDDVLDDVSDETLKSILIENKQEHKNVEQKINRLLDTMHEEEKKPAMLAKGMSIIKTHFKMSMEHSDATIADLITDGCDMGTKSLHRYKNQYKNADASSIELCNHLIALEETLREKLRNYL